ncbi:MAG: gluconokinase [Chloroflexi bacterium]|nr:gluconokinase [Chloroflexota bacterium]MBV9547137.1 gluconokinase [Chloroflexota bacterium]
MAGGEKRLVLALDIGTSSCRAIPYDLAGRRLGSRRAQVQYQPRVTAEGGAELDANGLFDQVCQTIETVLSQGREEIVAVATSTFWHSLLGVDENGEPLTPVYLWMDARSREQAAELRSTLDEHAVHARVGTVLHWSYWPAKLRWLQRTQPEVYRKVRHWISFGELLLGRLTGQWGVSTSMASGTGLLNAHTCQWDGEMLRAIGVDQDRLAAIRPLREMSSIKHKQWPRLREVPWLMAVGDGACSNLGAGCATPDWFALMIGTSGAERVVSCPPEGFSIPWGTWCYRVDEARVVMGGAFNDGGSLFDWLRHSFRLPQLNALEDALVDMEPDGHGLTLLPFWAGERSTGWTDDARGAIQGLRLHTQPIEIVRACLEAIALRFGELDRLLLEAMPVAGQVVATGGALLHSPAWMQIMADVLGRPVLASTELEASSRGASLLALEALGLLPEPLDRMPPATKQRFDPVAKHTEKYRAAGERQRHLYDQLVRASGASTHDR